MNGLEMARHFTDFYAGTVIERLAGEWIMESQELG
jgi:hypothetical protein